MGALRAATAAGMRPVMPYRLAGSPKTVASGRRPPVNRRRSCSSLPGRPLLAWRTCGEARGRLRMPTSSRRSGTPSFRSGCSEGAPLTARRCPSMRPAWRTSMIPSRKPVERGMPWRTGERFIGAELGRRRAGRATSAVALRLRPDALVMFLAALDQTIVATARGRRSSATSAAWPTSPG